MQAFFYRFTNSLTSKIKSTILANKKFFTINIIIFCGGLFFAFLLIHKNSSCLELCDIWDKTLYKFICGDISFFYFLIKKLFSLLLIFAFIILLFSNKILHHLSYFLNFYFSLSLFYNLIVLVKCLNVIGIVFGIIYFIFFNIIIFSLILLIQSSCLSKLKSRCSGFCLEFDYQFIFIMLLITLIIILAQCLISYIFYPIIIIIN